MKPEKEGKKRYSTKEDAPKKKKAKIFKTVGGVGLTKEEYWDYGYAGAKAKNEKGKKEKAFKTVNGVDFTKQEYKDYIRVLTDKKKKTKKKLGGFRDTFLEPGIENID
jgi:hypothetical protein